MSPKAMVLRVLSVPAAIALLVARLLPSRSASPGAANTASAPAVLLAPPGGGNIGDEAMVASFIKNTPGEVLVVVRRRADIRILSTVENRVSVVEMPHLFYRRSLRALVDLGRYWRLLGHARSVALVGADIMDGAYNEDASVARAQALELARRRGLDVRVLGFSWNGTASARATHHLRRASESGVIMCVRDEFSLARIVRDGISSTRQVSDVVFALFGDPSEQDLPQRDRVIVNASGLVARDGNMTSTYANVCSDLVSRGYSVTLLPHVIRGGGDDLAACRAVAGRLPAGTVEVVEGLLSPFEVYDLCRRAALVVSGRMHLGVIGLCAGAVPVLISTQGKVEGLMKFFGLEVNAVPIVSGQVATLPAVVEAALDSLDEMSARVDRELARVRHLASGNFE